MAQLESRLVAALEGVVPSVYPDTAPAGTPPPYVTWQQVGGRRDVFLEGGGASQRQVRMQINVWAASRMACTTLMRKIEDALIQPPLYGEPEGGAVSTYEELTPMYGATQDFYFWGDAP